MYSLYRLSCAALALALCTSMPATAKERINLVLAGGDARGIAALGRAFLNNQMLMGR